MNWPMLETSAFFKSVTYSANLLLKYRMGVLQIGLKNTV